MKKDFYQLLEISQTASVDEIKRSYRKLALKYHPDRNPVGDTHAESLFKQIVEAYNILAKAESRSEYDSYLLKKQHALSNHNHRPVYNDFSDTATATATAKKAEVVTAASLLKQFNSIRRQLNNVEDRSKIKQEALYKQLANSLSMKNISILRTADRKFIQQVIETVLDSCKHLSHSYLEGLTPRLIKLAGSDNEVIKKIYRHNKKHLRKKNWEKRKPYIIIGFVGAAILTYLIVALIFTSQK